MNIMVFDVPAEYGGALSILYEYYDEAKSCKDKSINWIFVVSKPKLKETDNIKVLRFPWIKKSWGHRLYFDNIISPKLVRKYKVDKVFSLQNLTIPRVDSNQILYIHQPLPFVDYRFTFKENRLFWIYQNLLSKSIIKSIKKADKVIVQTEWMKKVCMDKVVVGSEKISVVPPQINIDIKEFFKPNNGSLSTFFYPSSALTYKNHKLIIESCKKLKDKNIKEYKVIFTLQGDENDYVSKLYNEVKENQLPIEFIGSLSRNQVFDLYTKSVLLFPSYIETFGLPMLEARLHRGIVFASNCPFSHEILEDYENAYFFDQFNSEELCILMLSAIKGEMIYNTNLEMECNVKRTYASVMEILIY